MTKLILLFGLLSGTLLLAAQASVLDNIESLSDPFEESLRAYPPKTDLSKHALRLSVGMSKEEVLELLGTPTWAMQYRHNLAWEWKNGPCNPVRVLFDSMNMQVIGFDEGRVSCLNRDYDDLPSDRYACFHPDRARLCQ